ncbi:hypothetical protein HOY80DRAFT_1003879 [Tuber brumale]|nr:hypothetical protein HOY80DRAFT_1003879 [Tuber brumale]
MDLDYDSCVQFLARLEADPENLSTNINTTPNNVKGSNPNNRLGGSPASVLDTSLSLSPIDNRNSASPPGLSSGSVTSHSPESLRFEYDVTWNPNDPAFFPPIDEGILSSQAWDLMSSQGQPSDQQQQGRVVTPLNNDYIKVENDTSPGPYFGNSQQATISPTQSLIDPATQTALEGAYPFGKENDSLFDFTNYAGSGSVGQAQGSNPESSYSPLAWRNQGQQREDFPPLGWQSPPQAQQVPQQRQQQRQSPQSQEPINNLSPSSSHRTSSSPDSRAHDSHSDDNSTIPPRPKKRKTSTDDAALDGGASAPAPTPTTGRKQQPKKTAHNMIEKRYRTNLNDKIAALRDSVPSLRVMAGTSKLGEDDDDEDLEGLTPAHKLNKATVLAKATEYIRHLEKRTKRLQDENDQLKNRLAAFEKLATMGGPMGGAGQSSSGSRGGGGPGGGLMSRLMVGSLAGLMVANGLQEQENGTRQLIPFPTAIMQMFGIPEYSATTGSQLFWLAFKMVLLVSAVLYVIIPGFFDSKTKGKPKSNTLNSAALSPVPSLASSLEVRRTAWLTAIQSVWVPRRSFALEIAALACKTLKLSLRKLIGWNGYALLTGTTEEHEAARIKAWSIALDAQLAGGDATITHSRLMLTLLASLTLPATPSRLMLNALHIRVLFWDLGSSFESFADWLANYYWREARNLQQKSLNNTDSSAERLPEHLARLLDLDPNEVLHSKIIQKAYNLAYDRGTGEDCGGYDEGMDTVVEDESVRSPLDAVAAWYSSLVLQGVLATNLKTRNTELTRSRIAEDLEAALNVAPPNSKAQLRTLVTKAMLEDKDDGTTLRAALKAFEEDVQPHEPTPNSVPRIMVSRPHVPTAVTTDIKIVIRCAMALNLLRNGSRAGAIRLFSGLDWQGRGSVDIKNKLGLLGFVAIWKTLNRLIASDVCWAADAGESVDKAAGMLRVWIGGKDVSKRAGVHKDDCKKVIDFCNSLQKRLAGLSDDLDDGYASGALDTEKKNAGT